MISNEAFQPDEIFLIGAGGVGSRICSELSFFVRGNHTSLGGTWTTIVDHDHVSASNLNRQMYYPHEVSNSSKGQVLTNRYRDLFRVRQVPEAINTATIGKIFSEEVLKKKLLVICAADNGLVVKQVFEYLVEKAEDDYLVIFTGANLLKNNVSGRDIETGSGQAYAYGVLRGTPLYPVPPSEGLLDIMSLTGFGPSVTGQNCGVDATSGAQTPLMNLSCCLSVMTVLNFFFEKGIFIPSIYFTDGINFTFADKILLADLESNEIPKIEDAEEEILGKVEVSC